MNPTPKPSPDTAESRVELHRFVRPALVYFFGCLDTLNRGHYLYNKQGRRVYDYDAKSIPFQYTILDGGLLRMPEEQGRLHYAVINGWTVIGMWDRTGDHRGRSCSSFFCEGIFDLETMCKIAAHEYPALWKRIGPNRRAEGPGSTTPTPTDHAKNS